jgi:hypothetical protein
MRLRATLIVAATLSAVAACHSGGAPGAGVSAVAANRAGSGQSEWRDLLAGGPSLPAWRGYRADSPPPGWHLDGDVLKKDRPVADIMTRDEYSDFELSIEWAISAGGNSGILYRGTEEYDHIYWSAPEYQLLDDERAPDGKNVLTQAATDYALYARTGGKLNPVGEWNQTRIICRGAHVEHWLNGVKVVEYEFWSDDWKAKVAKSKFKDWPNYGLSRKGHISLQGDHPGSLMFRNIRIRELH